MKMEEFNDPKFMKIKAKYDKKIFNFIRGHTGKILKQMDADTEYQSCRADAPRIPIFDNYLSGLEAEIEDSIRKIGYFNGSATRLVNHYKVAFYYSALPNLSEHRRWQKYEVVNSQKKGY